MQAATNLIKADVNIWSLVLVEYRDTSASGCKARICGLNVSQTLLTSYSDSIA